MTVTVPDEILNKREVRNAIADVMQHKTAMELKSLFRTTVFGWSNKPSFRQKFTEHATEMSEAVYAYGRNAGQYALVNEGSPPHLISAVNTKFLRFRPGYRASTTPGFLVSRRNYRSGAYVYRKYVNHPGFEGRKFDELIAEEYYGTFYNDMADAIKLVVKS